ncbi:MAG: hypothetical protein V4634_16045 [Pseudomonadota bacterium]
MLLPSSTRQPMNYRRPVVVAIGLSVVVSVAAIAGFLLLKKPTPAIRPATLPANLKP